MQYATKHDIEYRMFYRKVLIPAGTPVEPATNLPESEEPLFFVSDPWPGISAEAESWHRNYGFLLEECEVTRQCEA